MIFCHCPVFYIFRHGPGRQRKGYGFCKYPHFHCERNPAGCCSGMAVKPVFETAYAKEHYVRNSMKVIIVLGVSFLLMSVENWVKPYISVSGLLAVVSMACVLKLRSIKAVSARLSEKFGKLWLAAEVLLFVLVGAAVDIRYTMGAGLAAVLMIFTALIFRTIGVLICLAGTALNWKERLFCVIAYLPKATVQAAIGSVPMAMGLPCGQIVLSVAVMAILITAPLGHLGWTVRLRSCWRRNEFFPKTDKNNSIAENTDNIWKKPHGFCIIREKNAGSGREEEWILGGGHNNSGNSVGVQQKSSMMDKLKNVFLFEKEVDQRAESDQNLVSQPQQQYHFQPTWNVVPDVNMAYDIRIQQDSRRRKSFAEKEREEQALRAEEEILLERERRSTARLESLLEAVKAHARRDSWVKIMQQELRDALHIVHKIRRAWDRTPGRVNKLREEYQDKLEHIYQLGEKYLTAEGEEAEYAELIKDVMEASDDAQLPSSRILLIRKERQYRKEDEKGYEHALQDHEVKQLDKETIEAIEYYTSAPPVHDGKSWYQYMNQFLRGLLPDGNKLPEENGVKETVLKMINRLGNAFQGKQKRRNGCIVD